VLKQGKDKTLGVKIRNNAPEDAGIKKGEGGESLERAGGGEKEE